AYFFPMKYFSIDCESIKNPQIPFGPNCLSQSQNSIQNFINILEQNSFQAELFITPACAKELHPFLSTFFKHHLLSLHIHLPAFSPKFYGQKIELANLSLKKQQEVLSEAVNIFTDIFGCLPSGFRPGMASANLHTIDILQNLGIFRGSISIPGLINKKYNVDWSKSPSIPHFIENFYNLPLTGNLCIDPNKNWDLPLTNYLPVYTHNWVNFAPNSFGALKLQECLKTRGF
ncbi:MAG: hypothetical protein ACRC37_04225, partial [Lentisphaeria bacterium]